MHAHVSEHVHLCVFVHLWSLFCVCIGVYMHVCTCLCVGVWSVFYALISVHIVHVCYVHYSYFEAYHIIICDWACENRAYLHTKFGFIFELQLTISFETQMLLQ